MNPVTQGRRSGARLFTLSAAPSRRRENTALLPELTFIVSDGKKLTADVYRQRPAKTHNQLTFIVSDR
jgi:hypothetical protein